MSAHTPGPWRINPNWLPPEYPDWREIISGHDKNYRRMSVSGHCGEANAHLIASAPDLLSALQSLLAAVDSDRVTGDELDAARTAIANAIGTPSP